VPLAQRSRERIASMIGELKNIVYDQWLAHILQREVYKIVVNDDLLEKTSGHTSTVYQLLRELQSRSVFLYSKVPTNFLPAVKFLEGLGFNLISTEVVFNKPISSHRFEGHSVVRFAVSEDQSQVVELARRSFVYSRFHLDSAFERKVADNTRAEWVKSYFAGKRGDAMVVAVVNEVAAGFSLLLYEKDGSLTMDLIAVDESHRRRGVAKDMIAYAESQYQRFTQIRVGTQLANIPSMGLYETMGFKMAEAQYIFHYHNP